jgi:hypothetical protein
MSTVVLYFCCLQSLILPFMKINRSLKMFDQNMILTASANDHYSIFKRFIFFDDHFTKWVEHLIPEFISILLLMYCWSSVCPIQNLAENSWLFLIAIFLTRFIWNITTIIHGLGHSVVDAVVEKNLGNISISNIIENRNLIELFQSFSPFTPIFVPFLSQQSPLWVAAGDPTPWKIRLKAAGGLLFNLIALLLGLFYFSGAVSALALASTPALITSVLVKFSGMVFICANLLILISSQSDLVAIVTGSADRFYCGNFGFIGSQQLIARQELMPENLLNLSKMMGRETEVRGEQAGGGLTLARDKKGHTVFVGHKIVNPKRGNLTDTLESAFSRTRRQKVRAGIRSLESTVLGAWHYRFGTSGPPAVLETHWHEWTPASIKTVWQMQNEQWVATSQNVNHRITHNGDFDSWRIFGEAIDNARLGLWLERVLHSPNHTVGDSPKIAGMMDLLITQGMWTPAVRLAYQLVIASSLADAFGSQEPSKDAPNTAPSETELHNWSNIFEAAFAGQSTRLSTADMIYAVDSIDQLQQDIAQQLTQDSQLKKLNKQQLIDFTRTAIQSFLYNNTYQAAKIFMAGAEGSFGLVIVSTLENERMVISALGQPITLGFDRLNKYAVYASEPTAVDVVLAELPGNYRLDLNQNTGEIAILGATDLVIYSMTENRELLHHELMQRRVPFQQHPYIQTSTGQSKDPIARDLQDIPRILNKIQTTWMDPASLNRRSAEYLLKLLVAKAKYLSNKQQKLKAQGMDPILAESRHVDLLITGVENSLWLGERFAKDLKTIYPALSIKTMSSNQVLHKLQYDFDSLQLAKQSIVFGISQSGQTFPTRQVLHACDLMVRQGVIQEYFILTGEPTSFIGSALGQPNFLSEPYSRRIFTNDSGRRTVEPATASVAATHQTLTELLFCLTRRMQLAFPNDRPLGMTLSAEGLLVLERMESEFLLHGITDTLGATVTGQDQQSRLHQQLTQGGRRWAAHITETPLAWFIQALYVLITVGWAIPFGYTIPLLQTVFKGILFVCQIPQNALISRILSPCLALADIAIYIFGAWLWTLGIRLVQKRELFARTGKRTLVIGDIHWVHQLLKNYVSKLFSLSYGIASLEVHGANPQDHLLHDFGHRVARGSLLFLGAPDGRCSENYQSKENAVLMTGKQAGGIQNLSAGPEIVLMGANPAISQQRFAKAFVLPSHIPASHNGKPLPTDKVIEALHESRFGSFRRLLASYVFFWALAKEVASFPLLQYAFWKSQSRTKIMTTAAPVSATNLDHPEQEEVTILSLSSVANREQS